MEEGISAEISEAVETIKSSGELYCKNWFPYLLIGIGFGLLNELTNVIINIFKNNALAVTFFINVFLSSFLTMSAINLSLQIVRQEKADLNLAFRSLGERYFNYIAVSLLSASIIIAGFFLLILPGIYFVTIFYFADLYVMMGKKGASEALKSSVFFVKGVFRRVFIGLLLIVCFLLLPMFLTQKMQEQNPMLSKILILVISVFLAPFACLAKVVLYEKVRKFKNEMLIEEV